MNIQKSGSSKVLKILYINYDFPPMSGPGVWRALWFIRHLSAEGFQFTVMCGDRSDWNDRFDESLMSQIPTGVDIVRLRAFFVKDIVTAIDRLTTKRAWLRTLFIPIRAIASQFSSWNPDPNLWWMIKGCLRAIFIARGQRFDRIITSGPPHVVHLVGLAVKKTCGTHWIMDYRDLWSDDPSQGRQVGISGRLSKRAERACVSNADRIVTVSPYWLSLLSKGDRAPRSADSFVLIRNGHNIDPIDSVPITPNVANGLTIHYNGTPQSLSETPHLVDALDRYRSEHSELSLPVITFCGLSRTLSALVSKKCLQDAVVDLGVLSYQESIETSRQADALLVIVNEEHSAMLGTIPAKTYEAIALHKHIFAIVPLRSDVRSLLTEYGNVTLCDVNDPDDVYRGLCALISRYHAGKLADTAANEHSNAFAQRFSRKELALQLAKVLRAAHERDL